MNQGTQVKNENQGNSFLLGSDHQNKNTDMKKKEEKVYVE